MSQKLRREAVEGCDLPLKRYVKLASTDLEAIVLPGQRPPKRSYKTMLIGPWDDPIAIAPDSLETATAQRQVLLPAAAPTTLLSAPEIV